MIFFLFALVRFIVVHNDTIPSTLASVITQRQWGNEVMVLNYYTLSSADY